MTAQDIIDLWRSETDDDTQPYRWSDDEAFDYLNDAINEANRRSRILVDSSTAAVCQLAIPTTGIATLDPRVIFVRKARIAGRQPMARMAMQDMEHCNPTWEDDSPSTYPDWFVPDWQTGVLRFHPPPSAPLTALLTVLRDPLVDVTKASDVPEIPARFHRSLRHWMAHRGYLKPDAETYRPDKAKEAEALFALEFGPKSAAIDELWIAREQIDGDGSYN